MAFAAPDPDVDVSAYVATHAGYCVDEEQPDYRGGTNRVTFGRRGREPVVFKRFVTAERYRNELACLRHFQPAGLVPRVLDTQGERLIVMSRLAGDGLHTVSPEHAPAVSERIGEALAALVRQPLPAEGPDYSPARDFRAILWGPSVAEALDAYLRICVRVLPLMPEGTRPFLAGSLAGIQAQAAHVARQTPVLFHEDISNLTVEGERFVGFYDLEMCRLGTEAMQLGVALGLCAAGPLSWPHLRRGFERATSRKLTADDLAAVVAMHHFYHWIRICRWGFWDGSAEAQGHREQAAAYAAKRVGEMEAARRLCL